MNAVALRLKPFRTIVMDLLAFAFGLGLALYSEWRAEELVWSLWLASLLVGGGTLLTMILHDAIWPQPMEGYGVPGPLFRVAKAVAMIVFFSIHFGMFHAIHAVFVWAFLPLADEPSPQLVWAYLPSMIPFVLMLAFGERERLLHSVRHFEPMAPYANVVRMHLLIFFFAGAAFLKLSPLWIFIVVYVVYFFPLQSKVKGQEGMASESAEGVKVAATR